MILLAGYSGKFGTSGVKPKNPILYFITHYNAISLTLKTSGHVFGGDYPHFENNDFASWLFREVWNVWGRPKNPILYFITHYNAISLTLKTSGHVFEGDYPHFENNDFASWLFREVWNVWGRPKNPILYFITHYNAISLT